jgi:hypothetical protein
MNPERQKVKQAFVSSLEIFHGLMASVGDIGPLVKEHAHTMGLESLGILALCPDEARVLKFRTGRIQWKEVCEVLLGIGVPTHIYVVESHRALGFRGGKGDVLVRISDIQRRRLEGVVQCLKEELE